MGWPVSGSDFRRSISRKRTSRLPWRSRVNFSSSALFGRCPHRSMYEVSSNVLFSASVSIGKPRYSRTPWSPSIQQRPDLAAGTPSSPGTYGTGEPAVEVVAVRSDIRSSAPPAAPGRRSGVCAMRVVANLLILSRAGLAVGRKSLDALDRLGIVGKELRGHQSRRELHPARILGEHFLEERRRFLLASELPKRRRLPEEELVVPGGESRRLGVGRERFLELSLGDLGVTLVALLVRAPESDQAPQLRDRLRAVLDAKIHDAIGPRLVRARALHDHDRGRLLSANVAARALSRLERLEEPLGE